MRSQLRFISLATTTLLFSIAAHSLLPISYKLSSVQAQSINAPKAEADQLFDQGNQLYRMSQFGAALKVWERALSIYRRLQNFDGEARVLSELGSVYTLLGQPQRAIQLHQQAIAIFRILQDSNAEARALGNLGWAFFRSGQYSQAAETFEQIYRLFQSTNDLSGEAQALINLGTTYMFLNRYADAIKLHEQALVIVQREKDRKLEARVLMSLGNNYLVIGKYARSVEYYLQSFPILREIGDRAGEGRAFHNIGTTLLLAGNPAVAEKWLLSAVEVWESLRPNLKDENKVSLFETQKSTYNLLQIALIAQNKVEFALEVAERGRARALVELLAKKLQQSESQQLVFDLPKISNLRQIAKTHNATLVQYSILADVGKVYTWVIQPTGNVILRQAELKLLLHKPNISLESFINTTRHVIGARSRTPTLVAKVSPQERNQQQKQLQQLHKLLVEPIADLLPKDPNQRVIFIPQSELFLVPFPALQGKDGKFLIEKHTILTAPSIQVLELTHQLRKRVKSQEPRGALVVGNPVMPRVRTEAGGAFEQLKPLTGAEREAQDIARLLKTKAITGSQATKSNILKQLAQAQFIHFATHGLLDDFKGLGVPGAIALGPDGTGQVNDGLLTSDEILDLKLNAELVVLSACDTGRGRITGDGVIGLSRSLITAGVPSIVVSLWKVPDRSTAFLMTEFYKNLQQDPDKAQALRQAMLSTKAKYPDPLDWAAFTLIGESQ